MRRYLRKHIPSMFHRRLVLLGGCVVVVLAVLLGQSARLTTGADARRAREVAESTLQVREWIPTVRGQILDRRGRVLATDDAGWEVAVEYSVITGQWAYDQAEDAARDAYQGEWAEMTDAAREAAIQLAKAPYDEQIEMLWQTLAALSGRERIEIERRKNGIRQRVQTSSSYQQLRWWRQKRKELDEDIPFTETMQPIREQRMAHTILFHAKEPARVGVQSFIAEAEENRARLDDGEVNPMLVWTQVIVRRPKQRRYPFETITLELDRSHMPTPLRRDEPLEISVQGVATHLLGGMRDVWAADINGPDARPFVQDNGQIDLGGYRDGDTVGHQGLEGRYEPVLRGARGMLIRHLDSGYNERVEPAPGRDVHLTLDIQLQARIQAIMTPNPAPDWPGLMTIQPWHRKDVPEKEIGHPLNGAVVVLEISTGEVLAAVSTPSMPADVLRNHPEKIYQDAVNMPWVNRAVARPYPPGSTIKPIMLVSAVTAGQTNLNEPIYCHGPLDPAHPNRMRCWIYKHYGLEHGPLLGTEAIARSCNVYFYTLGRRMGNQKTIAWYHKFGLGSPTNCGVGIAGQGGVEVGGTVGNPPGQRWHADAIFMGIGQGPVAWTPMQAVAAYGILARGGYRLSPTLVRPQDRLTPRRQGDLHLNPHAVEAALQGLHDVVNAHYGTGRNISLLREKIFNIDGVTVFGKSGTADSGTWRWLDSNGNGKEDEADRYIKDPRDHAWFMAMVQPDGEPQPTHIIAVVTEYAGSGGQVSGPVANQVILALKQEGYL